MSDDASQPLINVSLTGNMAKPADTLIKKLSSLVGGALEPIHIRWKANADSYAKKLEAQTRRDEEIAELNHQTIIELLGQVNDRFLKQGIREQKNINSITRIALPDVTDNAQPENLDDDWVIYFFNKAKLTSDEDIQSLWARILAGEANKPGRFSKRTIDFVASMDKQDGEIFTRLCSFNFQILGNKPSYVPVIFDHHDSVYKKQGINFDELQHLENIGLITFNNVESYGFNPDDPPLRTVCFDYYGEHLEAKIERDGVLLGTGAVLFSRIGQELAPIANGKMLPGFLDYALDKWLYDGHLIYSVYPRKTGN